MLQYEVGDVAGCGRLEVVLMLVSEPFFKRSKVEGRY